MKNNCENRTILERPRPCAANALSANGTYANPEPRPPAVSNPNPDVSR